MHAHVGLFNHVAPRRFAEPQRAQLGRSFLGLEVHIDQPEAVAVAVDPLEVVHRAPVEAALERNAFGRGALLPHHAVAQVHHTVVVVDVAVLRNLVGSSAAVLGDEDLLRLPDLVQQPRRPILRLWNEPMPVREHLRMGDTERHLLVAGRLVGCPCRERRDVDIDADEVDRRDPLASRLPAARTLNCESSLPLRAQVAMELNSLSESNRRTQSGDEGVLGIAERWIDVLKIGGNEKPVAYCAAIERLDPLLVIERHERIEYALEIIAEIDVEVADAK